MSSLPILNSQPPSSRKTDTGKTGNTAPGAEDISNGAAPFGELLAKQLNPDAHDIKRALLKTLASAQSDAAPADPNAIPLLTTADTRSDGIALPSDLLASLLQNIPGRSAGDQKITTTDSAASDNALHDDSHALRTASHATTAKYAETQLTRRITSPDTQATRASHAASAEPLSASTDPVVAGALAAALQAGKKTDNVLSPVPAANPVAPALGALNAPAAPAPLSSPTAIATPLQQPQWADDFSQKVTWLATQRVQSAELHLNPAQLGPLEVSLKLNGDQASVQFISAHAVVRDAIEQSLPRLRDMLADSGITLGNTTVSDQAPREQRERAQTGNAAQTNATDNFSEAEIQKSQTTRLPSRHNGSVDTFV